MGEWQNNYSLIAYHREQPLNKPTALLLMNGFGIRMMPPKEERLLLSICEGATMPELELVAPQCGLSIDKLPALLAKLQQKGLVMIRNIDGTERYQHTNNVTSKMLDDKAHYQFGARPRYTYPQK